MAKSIVSFSIVILVIFGLIMIAFNGLSFGSIEIPSVANGVVKGLDLVGGSSITFEALPGDGVTQADIDAGMGSVRDMLRRRLDSMNYSEATVALMGTNRVVVEIPSITDPEEAVALLGSTAKLEFRDSDGNVVMDGKDIEKAEAVYGQMDEAGTVGHYVRLTIKSESVYKFAEATRLAAEKPEGSNYIAIVMDGKVQSQPRVESEINSSTCSITGNYDAEGATQLANLITSGQLPFALHDIELRSVGPTLGERSLETSMTAALIGICLVALFLIAFYRLPGLIASISLAAYTVLVALILVITRVNLSLPGIAGIILSIGMAVDANVIIFERIKEELRSGKTVKASVTSGFKRAFTAIIDSNVTTIIAALVLKILGTGPVIGFADTLLIGVITSMFTAIVLSRFLLLRLVDMNVRNIKAYGV